MLSKLFGSKSDHPMADIKSVQDFLADLPKNDTYKALAELTESLESVAEHADFKVDYQFTVIRLLDDAAQPHVRKLSRDFFTPHELNTFQENRLWSALDKVSRSTATAYFCVFKRYANNEKGSNAIKPQLPFLLSHTINAYLAQLKYVCARYGVIEKTVWENVAQIHNFAEQQQCLDIPVHLTPGAAEVSSVKAQVARLLGWYGSGVNAMSPLAINLSERIVTQYGATIDMHVQQTPDDFLSFDFAQPDAPRRITDEAIARPTLRFINMTAMQPQLEVLITVLNKNVLPDNLHLGGGYEASVVLEVAQSLLNTLKEPPLRGTIRHKIKVSLTAVSGFESVLDSINAGLNLGKAKPVQWELEDISANGFLTIVPPPGTENLRIGSLLGVQPVGLSHWGAALVRRLSRDENNQLHIGVEILANQVSCVALMQSGTAAGYFEEGQLALWLHEKQGEASSEAQLLMHADVFSDGRSLQTEVDEKNYLLIPNGLIEKGSDYDLAKFRLIEQEGSHTEESY